MAVDHAMQKSCINYFSAPKQIGVTYLKLGRCGEENMVVRTLARTICACIARGHLVTGGEIDCPQAEEAGGKCLEHVVGNFRPAQINLRGEQANDTASMHNGPVSGGPCTQIPRNNGLQKHIHLVKRGATRNLS